MRSVIAAFQTDEGHLMKSAEGGMIGHAGSRDALVNRRWLDTNALIKSECVLKMHFPARESVTSVQNPELVALADKRHCQWGTDVYHCTNQQL